MGRKPKYPSEAELIKKIEEYFAKCDENTRVRYDKDGEPYQIDAPIPYSIEGICNVLGLTRQSWHETYKVKFPDTFAWASERVTQQRIEGAMMGDFNPIFAKFLLLNNDSVNYREKQEIEHSADKGLLGLLESINGTANKLPGGSDKK